MGCDFTQSDPTATTPTGRPYLSWMMNVDLLTIARGRRRLLSHVRRLPKPREHRTARRVDTRLHLACAHTRRGSHGTVVSATSRRHDAGSRSARRSPPRWTCPRVAPSSSSPAAMDRSHGLDGYASGRQLVERRLGELAGWCWRGSPTGRPRWGLPSQPHTCPRPDRPVAVRGVNRAAGRGRRETSGRARLLRRRPRPPRTGRPGVGR